MDGNGALLKWITELLRNEQAWTDWPAKQHVSQAAKDELLTAQLCFTFRTSRDQRALDRRVTALHQALCSRKPLELIREIGMDLICVLWDVGTEFKNSNDVEYPETIDLTHDWHDIADSLLCAALGRTDHSSGIDESMRVDVSLYVVFMSALSEHLRVCPSCKFVSSISLDVLGGLASFRRIPNEPSIAAARVHLLIFWQMCWSIRVDVDASVDWSQPAIEWSADD